MTDRKVLPLVVRIERAVPPERTDALEAAALAVLTLLDDPRAAGEGEWARAVADWEAAGIGKVVRRARGAEWRRVLDLPGVTVVSGAAGVVHGDRGRAVAPGRLPPGGFRTAPAGLTPSVPGGGRKGVVPACSTTAAES